MEKKKKNIYNMLILIHIVDTAINTFFFSFLFFVSQKKAENCALLRGTTRKVSFSK